MSSRSAELHAWRFPVLDVLDPTPFFTKYGPPGNARAIFKSYLDAAAHAAADGFTTTNAEPMVNSARIDTGILGSFGVHP